MEGVIQKGFEKFSDNFSAQVQNKDYFTETQFH